MKRKNSLSNLIAGNKKVYLSICACLLAVYALLIAGITSATNKNKLEKNPGEDIKNVADGSDIFKATPTPALSDDDKSKENDANVSSSNTEVNENKDNENKQPTKEPARKVDFNREKGIVMPVNGKVLMKYSMDHTIYNKTLCQYMVNDGVLLQANVGSSVVACCDGIVTNVYEDTRHGKCVDVQAGDYVFTYGQLKSADVSKGDLIKEGNLVGNVGEPSKYYSKEGSHLYFSVHKGDESINPDSLVRSRES